MAKTRILTRLPMFDWLGGHLRVTEQVCEWMMDLFWVNTWSNCVWFMDQLYLYVFTTTSVNLDFSMTYRHDTLGVMAATRICHGGKPPWHIPLNDIFVYVMATTFIRTLHDISQWHILDLMTYLNDTFNDISPWHIPSMTPSMTYWFPSTLAWHIRPDSNLSVSRWGRICHGGHMSWGYVIKSYVMVSICHEHVSWAYVMESYVQVPLMCVIMTCHEGMSLRYIMQVVWQGYNMTFMTYLNDTFNDIFNDIAWWHIYVCHEDMSWRYVMKICHEDMSLIYVITIYHEGHVPSF